MLSRIFFLLAGSAMLGLAGCSGSGGSGDYATVTGVVSYKGTPVEGAKVMFISTTETEGGKATYGTVTDSSGKYMLAGVSGKPGISPGMYKVTVTKLTLKEGFKPPADAEAWDLEQLELSGMGKNVLPKQHGSENTTKLSATIERGKNEKVNFDLKDK